MYLYIIVGGLFFFLSETASVVYLGGIAKLLNPPGANKGFKRMTMIPSMPCSAGWKPVPDLNSDARIASGALARGAAHQPLKNIKH